MITAARGLQVSSPFGPITFRASDGQSTLGTFVGRTAVKDGRGVMVDSVYRDGAAYMPSEEMVKALRPAE
jgi:branched-chain amino acid transport system substrate-binding protein